VSAPTQPAAGDTEPSADDSSHDDQLVIEDVDPGSGPTFRQIDFLENEIPRDKETFRVTAPTHDQTTRKGLAFTVLGLIAVLYGAAAYGLISGALDQDGFALLITGLSGPQALGAAVIGFYYGKKDD
jgi:hypothetical protein